MKVLWTDQAFERLAEIKESIAMDDPATAQRFVDRLIARSQALADYPGLGRKLPELPGRCRGKRSQAIKAVARHQTLRVAIRPESSTLNVTGRGPDRRQTAEWVVIKAR